MQSGLKASPKFGYAQVGLTSIDGKKRREQGFERRL